jgi:pimeloyl-ACP methyl ester carboxylesterase
VIRRRAAAVAAVLVMVVGACSNGTDDTTAVPDEAAEAAGTATTADASDDTGAPEETETPDDAASAATEAADGEPAEAADGESDPGATSAGAPVRFATPDGQELAGTMYGDGPTGVVLAHMRGRDQATWSAFAAEAAAAGHRVLTFDFRGYGQSTGARDTELSTDLRAAIALMADEEVDRIVVIGASMGGTAAIDVASDAELAGVVALSAPANFMGLEAAGVAIDVGEPLLAIAAEDDAPYADDARAITDAALTPTLEILPGSAHGTNLFADHGDVLTDLLLEFIAARSA